MEEQSFKNELTKIKREKPHAFLKILKLIFKNEIDDTIGNKNISFNDFKANIDEYSQKPYIKKMIHFYNNPKYIKKTDEDKLQRIFSLYYGSINIFKPVVAYQICMRYKPKTVLDPFAGFGSRAIGCSVAGCNYIGIDSNDRLKGGYENVIDNLASLNLIKPMFIIDDCLNIDYSKFEYDFILTSPPYYNLEVYSFMKKRTKREWNKFYKEIFTKVFEHLKLGGYMCLNVNQSIYDKILLPIFKEPLDRVEYPKNKRNHKSNKEYIYIWHKI